jgi:hypothetical protein
MKREVAYLERSKAAVVYQDKWRFAQGNNIAEGIVQKTIESNATESEKYICWGTDKNDEPKKLITNLLANNMANPILTTKSQFIVGKEIFLYKKVYANGKVNIEVVETPAEIDEFFKSSEIETVLFNCEKDIQQLGNGFLHAVYNRDKTKVSRLHHVDAGYCRLGKNNTNGYPDKIFHSLDWTNPTFTEKEGNTKAYKAYIPFKYIEAQLIDVDTWIAAMSPEFIFHLKEYQSGFPYYGVPSWYGARTWLELANMIPNFHLSGLRNGYSIRYLVEVSDAFFAGISDEEELEKAKDRLQDEIDEHLAGAENAGKALYAYMNNNLFAEKGVIRLTPIGANLNDSAFTTLFDSSNDATTSGFTLPPALAAIQQKGGISSGSEMEHAYNIWIASHTIQPRRILLEPLRAIFKINKWDILYPGLEIGIKNVELTTLDKNPTGTQTATAV